MAHNLPVFQGLKRCIQYLDSHPHKPILYICNYYDGSNVLIIIWSGNQVEDCTTRNCLECFQDLYHARILNIRRSFSVFIHAQIRVAVCWRLHIQPYMASNSNGVEIRCMYRSVKKNKGFCRYMEALALHTGATTVQC